MYSTPVCRLSAILCCFCLVFDHKTLANQTTTILQADYSYADDYEYVEDEYKFDHQHDEDKHDHDHLSDPDHDHYDDGLANEDNGLLQSFGGLFFNLLTGKESENDGHSHEHENHDEHHKNKNNIITYDNFDNEDLDEHDHGNRMSVEHSVDQENLPPKTVQFYSKKSVHDNHVHSNHQNPASDKYKTSNPQLTTWIASLGSVLVISLVGLAAVSVLPLLRGSHQAAVLQLLVALAVGTLVADSLIHLVPHALGATHGDTGPVWKGFLSTITVIMMFVMDKVMVLMGHGHTHGHGADFESDEELFIDEKGSEQKEFIKNDMTMDLTSYTPPPKYEEGFIEDTDIPKEHSTMTPAARMVIVGDAVHNFADGLAVGAAFTIGLGAGFSTSVAVLCHELPHEVGDFAILLRSGMSTKSAIFYNLVSSITAVIGMAAGLLLSSTGSTSSWLLSATVGVFLYVSLVSMMTELGGKSNLSDIFISTLGMFGGSVLLLIIGLYEHDLTELLGGDH